MAPTGRARRAIGVALALAAAGCGSSPSAAPRTTTAGAIATPAKEPVRIDAPRPRQVVRARRPDRAHVELALTVSGHAQSVDTVEVRARCRQPACSRVVFSDPGGGWTARLNLLLPRTSRRLTVSAGYAGDRGARGRARVRLRIRPVGPAPAAAPAPKRAGSERAPAASAPAPAPAPATSPETESTTTPAPPPPAAPPGLGGRRTGLVLVGDSLAVGIRPLLPALLPGWKVRVDGRVGRPLAEGMGIVAATPLPADGREVLAVSLFTNDAPTRTAQLQAAVRTTLERAGPRGCVIWATVARPRQHGVSYRAANDVLERMAASDPRLRLVPWARQVAAAPSLLGADRVHPTAAGYRLRAQLYAAAARSC